MGIKDNSRRDEIIEVLETALSQISPANSYNTDFDKITDSQDTPTEYKKNHLNFYDLDEDYQWQNNHYEATLDIFIDAVVMESAEKAKELGRLALKDIVRAVKTINLCGCKFRLGSSSIWTETKGKTACRVELKVKASYKFAS